MPEQLIEIENSSLTQIEQRLSISWILASQPDSAWLEELETKDQLMYWLKYKKKFLWIAQCWLSRHFLQSDPLRPVLKAGEVTQNEYNIIWATEIMIERLWALCQLTEPFIQEIFEQAKLEYPFASSTDLFTQIVKDLTNPHFAVCLESYTECSRPKREKALRLLAKAFKGIQLTKVQEKIVESQKPEYPLTALLLGVADKAAKKEVIIKYALEDYYTAGARLATCYATGYHNHGSHAWINGKVVKGSQIGTYSLQNS